MAQAVTIRISAQAAQAISQLNATAAATERLSAAGVTAGKNLQRTGQTMTRVGASLTRNVTLPIGLAGAASVKLAVDFDTSLNHIQALVGASTGQMETYRKSILALAPAVGKGPKELADALYFITSSGFKGAQALSILEAGAKASAAGLGDTQTVVDLVTSAVNAYGIKSLSAAKATDVLTAAVRLGKAEPQALAQAMGHVIPLAQAMGVSFGEASGAVAALTLTGLDADTAVTGLRNVLSKLLAPGADAKKALDGVGLSTKQLRAEVSDKGLQTALLDLNKRFKGNTDELHRVLPDARGFAAALALIGPNAAKDAGIIRDVTAATGDTAKAFDKASKNEMFKFKQALAQLEVTGISLGTALVPVLVDIAGGVKTVAEAFGGLSPEMQKTVLIGAGILAVMGPVLTIVGNTTVAVGAFKVALAGANAEAAAGGAAGGAQGIGGLVGTFARITAANPAVGIALLGTALVGVGAYYFSTKTASDALTQSLDDQKAAIQGVSDALLASKNADLAAQQASLDVKTTSEAVREAEQAYQTALHDTGNTSAATRRASLALAQARISNQQAVLRETATENAANDARDKSGKTINRVRGTVERLTAAYKRDLIHQDQVQGGLKNAEGVNNKYIESLHKAADSLREQARVAKQNGEPALAALEIKEANAADAAAKLASQVGASYNQLVNLRRAILNIPTKRDIYITTHFAELHTGSHKNVDPTTNAAGGIRTHAAGGVTLRPIQVDNDIYGEAGHEAILPLESPGGRRALATALRDAGGGGGGWVMFGEGAFKGANFYGAPTGDAAKMWAKAIEPHAARFTARRG